jgi:hypothetical protein
MKLPHDGQVDALVQIYRTAEERLMRSIESAVASGQLGTAAYRRSQLGQVQGLLTQLQAATVPQAVAIVSASYTEGLRIAQVAGVQGAFGGIHTEAVAVLSDSLSNRLGQGFANIGRQAEDVFRREGLRLSALQLAEGSTRVEASKGMAEALVKQGTSTFIDKAGRDWGLSRYTEMVMRTTTREAVSEGTKNRLIEGGIDLVTWDATGEACDICGPLDGVTYSLTGDSDEYEQLVDPPPAHPNCECVLTPSAVTLDELEAALEGSDQ